MRKGLLQVLIANIINLAIGLVNSFFLPKYLSVDTYAMIKTYTLYINYAGFFHLGYLDGMYLKYGGEELKDVTGDEFGSDFRNVFLMEILFGAGIATVAFVLHDSIILAFAFGMLFNNIISCFQMLFQAVGEFKLYSSALNYKPFIALVGSLLLLFVFKSDNYIPYIMCQLLASLIPMIYLGRLLNQRIHYWGKGHVNKKGYKSNISSGFVLMLGNFSSNLFTGIDRWFVKFLMTTTDFAIYSFAVSIDSIINIFVTPIAITLYNTLCKEHDIDKIKYMKRMILIWGLTVISLAFPAKWVVEHFLDKYIGAIDIIFWLFGAQAFYAVIKGLYVNMYKARKKQNIYFIQMVAMTGTAAATNAIFYFFYRSSIAFAMATFATALIWLITNEVQNRDLAFSFKEIFYLATLLCVFFFCGYRFGAIVGFIVYIVVLCILSMALLRGPFLEMINTLLGVFHKRIKSGTGK